MNHEDERWDDEVFGAGPVNVKTPTVSTAATSTTPATYNTIYNIPRVMKPPPSSPTPPPPPSPGPTSHNRGRRWSLDVISPLRLLVTPHSTSTSATGRRPSTPESHSGSGTSSPTLGATAPASLGGRRYSQPILPKVKPLGKDKRAKVKDVGGAGKKDGKGGHHHKVKEGFVVITLDTGQTIVVSFIKKKKNIA